LSPLNCLYLFLLSLTPSPLHCGEARPGAD
jgi:hypothetical protein